MIGKKTYYYFCWHLWTQYNRICRNIKIMLHYHTYHWPGLCFTAWSKWAREIRTDRDRILRKFSMRFGTGDKGPLYYTFSLWITYSKRVKLILQKAKRILKNPHFGKWVAFTDYKKHVRNMNRACVVIQARVRGRNARRLFEDKREAARSLRHFYMIVSAKVLALLRRNKVTRQEFAVWWKVEAEERATTRNESERVRLGRLTTTVQTSEKSANTALTKHLRKTVDGSIQMQVLMEDMLKDKHRPDKDTVKRLSPDQLKELSRQELLTRCGKLARLQAAHNYNVRSPVYLQCPHTRCRGIFTTELQYFRHFWVARDLHAVNSPSPVPVIPQEEPEDIPFDSADNIKFSLNRLPIMGRLHIMLAHAKGAELLKDFITTILPNNLPPLPMGETIAKTKNFWSSIYDNKASQGANDPPPIVQAYWPATALSLAYCVDA